MEWEKAKTFLIVLLILLNAGLFAMDIYGGKSYMMTQAEIFAITDVLEKNGITLACGLPLESKPAGLISLSAAEWDYDFVRNTFFPNEEVTRTMEGGNVIYRSADGKRAATVTYTQSENVSLLIYSEEAAASRQPDDYIKRLGSSFGGFELCRQFEDTDGSKTYLYNDFTKDGALFVSSAEVTYSGESVTVSVRKYDFVSYVEGTHDISAADAALLTFMHYKSEYLSENVTIEVVQYGFGADGDTDGNELKAKPYYRVFVSGTAEPVYINAIMNTIYEGAR